MVLGATGGFGRRLVDGLARTRRFDLVLAARDETALAAACVAHSAVHPEIVFESAPLDRDAATPATLARHAPWLVIDAAGPFQGATTDFARAVVQAGAHYLDLADARDFVARIGEIDADAKAAGVVALSGASSTPALSNAALDEMTRGWTRIDAVEAAITTGRSAPRGRSLVAAILSQIGQPVRVFVDGREATRPGWSMTVRRRVPGIGPRVLSLCETPDLDLFVERFRPRDRAVFRAGLEPAVLHWGTWALSFPVRWGWARSLLKRRELLRRLAALLFPFGRDRSAMFVEAWGRDAKGAPARARWTLRARGLDGPAVPTLVAVAGALAIDDGVLATPGAGPCVGRLSRDAILAAGAHLDLETEAATGPRPLLFPDAMGADFAKVARSVRALHEPIAGANAWTGRADVLAPDNLLGRLVARVYGFPRAARDIPCRVIIRADDRGETWERVFAAPGMHSRLAATRTPGVISERFGAASFRMRLEPSPDGGIDYRLIGWRLFGVPMPRALGPRSTARESVDGQGRFTFDVTISAPLIGRLAGYRGWLVAEDALMSP